MKVRINPRSVQDEVEKALGVKVVSVVVHGDGTLELEIKGDLDATKERALADLVRLWRR